MLNGKEREKEGLDYCREEDAFGKTSDCISELVFCTTVGGTGKAFHRRLGNILYSGSNAAPLARADKKLEIWSDLYNLSQNHILPLSFLHTKAPYLCWFVPFFQSIAISHEWGELSSGSVRCWAASSHKRRVDENSSPQDLIRVS